ncbi:hypothetical protein R6Q59_001549 [Mikania micrantha]
MIQTMCRTAQLARLQTHETRHLHSTQEKQSLWPLRQRLQPYNLKLHKLVPHRCLMWHYIHTRGVARSLFITQFARAMGIYIEEELQQPLYGDSNVILCTWWPTITDGALHGTTRASWIRYPLHRYTHRIIADTIAGRRENRERVTFTDAFLLYCMLPPASCNIAIALASYFEAHRGRPVASQLAGGAFITRLAAGLDIDIARLTPVSSRLLDLTAIR